MTYKNVIQAGITGTVGKPIFDAIRGAGIPITALTRSGSSSIVPPGIPIKTVDYADYSALVDALRGHDALILTLANAGVAEHSRRFVDAAIEAGVERIIPSEFGADTELISSNHPLYQPKIEANAYIKSKASESKITYTNIITGLLLDWGLDTAFLGFDLKKHTALLWDGGKRPFRTTSLRTIGQSVVGVLRNPEATSNKTIRISDALITQLELLSSIEALTSKKFTVSEISAEEAGRLGGEAMKKGEMTFENIRGFLNAAVFGDVSVARWADAENENNLVGLSEHPAGWEKVVEEAVRQAEASSGTSRFSATV